MDKLAFGGGSMDISLSMERALPLFSFSNVDLGAGVPFRRWRNPKSEESSRTPSANVTVLVPPKRVEVFSAGKEVRVSAVCGACLRLSNGFIPIVVVVVDGDDVNSRGPAASASRCSS